MTYQNDYCIPKDDIILEEEEKEAPEETEPNTNENNNPTNNIPNNQPDNNINTMPPTENTIIPNE